MIFNMNGGGEQKLKKSTGEIEARQEEDYIRIYDESGIEFTDIGIWAIVITLPDGLKYYDVKAMNAGLYMRYSIFIDPIQGEEVEHAFLIMYDPETDIYTLVEPKSGDVYGTSDYNSHVNYDYESQIVIGCDPELIHYNKPVIIYNDRLIGNVYY